MPSTTNTPTFDKRVLHQYLTILNESIRRLETHAARSRADFLKDDDAVRANARIDAAQNRLRLAIESCSDIARHLIARMAWGRPQSYNQAFATLAKNGVLPEKWKTAGRNLAWLSPDPRLSPHHERGHLPAPASTASAATRVRSARQRIPAPGGDGNTPTTKHGGQALNVGRGAYFNAFMAFARSSALSTAR